MIVCRECGYRNASGTTFCENRDCGSFLEWTGDAFPTEAFPQVKVAQGPGWGASSAERVGPSQIGVTVKLPERELNVEPGKTAGCEVTIGNTGRIVDQYTIQVFGDAARWTTVEPPTVNLVPDAEGTVKVTFHPPRRADVTAGTRPFRIVVTSREDLRASTFADGTITVGPFHEVATHLRQQHGEGRSATYEVVVENRGNAPVVARLAAVDERQALDLKVSDPALTVPPGGWSSASVQAQPRQRPLSGQPATYPFRVTAQAGWETPRSMDARFVYRPLLPPVGGGGLAMLRILLTLLGGLIMIFGAFADWVPDVAGTELTYEGYVDGVFGGDVPSPPEGISTTFVSLGLIVVVLGVVAWLGLVTRTGGPTRFAGVVALLLMLVFVFTVADAGISLGSGPFVVLFGAIVALVGGIVARIDKKS